MKPVQSKLLLKALSPKMIAAASAAFDRATLVIVAVCWAAALLMTVFALYTVHLSLIAKDTAAAALATEPVLPRQVTKVIEAREIQPMIDRLQHIYPDIAFSFRNNLTVSAVDGSKFHEWLTALGYIDTISPQYHWVLQEFCVGKCSGRELMRAVLTGEKVSFEAPQSGTKH